MAKVKRLLRPGPILAREVAIMHTHTHPTHYTHLLTMASYNALINLCDKLVQHNCYYINSDFFYFFYFYQKHIKLIQDNLITHYKTLQI